MVTKGGRNETNTSSLRFPYNAAYSKGNIHYWNNHMQFMHSAAFASVAVAPGTMPFGSGL